MLCYKMVFYKKKIKCYKLNLKIILENKFFEINFLKTFWCSKKKKVPKKSKKNYLKCFFSGWVLGTPVHFGRMTVRGHPVILKLNFSKSCDHKKSFFIGT
jgi:hypothetical protein